VADEKKSSESIKAFWDEQAKKYQDSLKATTPDPLGKELEVDALKREIDPDIPTLEAGCGNGYNIFQLEKFSNEKLVGFDYSQNMIDAANKRLSELDGLNDKIRFFCTSILDDLSFLGKFHQIFTDRCLINLLSLEQQIAAVASLSTILELGGRLVLIENTRQGQEALNELRKQVGLEEIPYHWHNFYLDEDEFLAQIPSCLSLEKIDHFSSLYSVISRVFNAKLTPKGSAPDYLAEINRIARILPSFGKYGPIKMFVFRKVIDKTSST
jgi:SAM-dependent methyltransferase